MSLCVLGLTACKKSAPVDTQREEDAQVEGIDGNEFVGSIGDLLKAGKNVTCTFTRTDEAGEMEGRVYVAGTKMRGEFVMTNATFGTMTMHVLRDGDYGYSWGFPSETQGTKVKLDSEGKPVQVSAKDEPGIDDPMEYRCSSWRADASKFILPSTVTFQDISAQVEQMQKVMQDKKSAQCGACDQVPEGSGRDQCKQAMGC